MGQVILKGQNMKELNIHLKRFEKSLNFKIIFGALLMTCTLIILLYKPTIKIFSIPKQVEAIILNQKELIEQYPVRTALEKTLQQESSRYLYINLLQMRLAMRAIESVFLINLFVIGMLILSYGIIEKIFLKKVKHCLDTDKT